VKYWIDTEFIERPYTIDLISVGLVAEDGREFYAESNEVDWSKASQWTLLNVRPQLDGKGMRREEIGYAVRRFTDGDEHPVFWGYFPAYDWVAFSWLFGSMDELPFHYPQLCLDIKQWAIELGDPELPHQLGARHSFLAGAGRLRACRSQGGSRLWIGRNWSTWGSMARMPLALASKPEKRSSGLSQMSRRHERCRRSISNARRSSGSRSSPSVIRSTIAP
jgi:hypothetical protein